MSAFIRAGVAMIALLLVAWSVVMWTYDRQLDAAHQRDERAQRAEVDRAAALLADEVAYAGRVARGEIPASTPHSYRVLPDGTAVEAPPADGPDLTATPYVVNQRARAAASARGHRGVGVTTWRDRRYLAVQTDAGTGLLPLEDVGLRIEAASLVKLTRRGPWMLAPEEPGLLPLRVDLAFQKSTRRRAAEGAVTPQTRLLLQLGVVLASLLWIALVIGYSLGRRDLEIARAQERDALLQRMSHDLRTPIAAAGSLLDALATGATTPDEEAQLHALVRTELRQLATGMDRLLRAARGEGPPEVAPVTLDLVEWARGTRDRWLPRLPGLLLDAPEHLAASVDPERLDEAVSALLDNARRYGGSAVRLEVVACGDRVRIAVTDDGPGVPVDARRHLFERGQRASSRPGGYGIGLWAARQVAVAHGGTLTLEGANTFALELPRSGS